MRKFFTPSLLLFCSVACAQLKKGDWNIGTNTNALSNFSLRSSNSGFRSYDFRINPTFGYFVTDRLEIGSGPLLSFSGSRYTYPDNNVISKNNSSSYGLNLYTRYYLKKEGKFVPYLTANIGYVRTNMVSYTSSSNKSRYSYNEWQAGGGIGANWFVGPRAALFTELTYSGLWGNGSGYNRALNLNIGFQIYLTGRKKK
jgi:hypothetical protein